MTGSHRRCHDEEETKKETTFAAAAWGGFSFHM